MSNEKTSFILPSRNERYLGNTIQSILDNCEGEIECVAVLEGYWPAKEDLIQDERVIYLYHPVPLGMRRSIDDAAAIATGKYLCKIDAHCAVSKNFDTALKAYSQPNIMQVPERGRLDVETYTEQYQDPIKKPPVSSEFLSYPDDPNDFGGASMTGKIWTSKIHENKDILFFPICASQGSCWFLEKSLFEKCGGTNEELFGDFWSESQMWTLELFLKQRKKDEVVLEGKYPTGVYTNKTAKFLHLHKGKSAIGYDGRKGRGYFLREASLKKGRDAVMRFYYGEKVLKDQERPLSYLISLFPDMPGWTSDRVEALKERERLNGWNV